MKVTYDPDHYLAYIYLKDEIGVDEAVRHRWLSSDSIILAYDAVGRLIGIEVLNCRLLHPALKALAVPPGEDLPRLLDAAERVLNAREDALS
jgi:uncharacterized protein YuzE